jgi:hypothetical protein
MYFIPSLQYSACTMYMMVNLWAQEDDDGLTA